MSSLSRRAASSPLSSDEQDTFSCFSPYFTMDAYESQGTEGHTSFQEYMYSRIGMCWKARPEMAPCWRTSASLVSRYHSTIHDPCSHDIPVDLPTQP